MKKQERQVSTTYRSDELLVERKPSFAHAGLAIEASSELLKLLLADEFVVECQFALMFSLVQSFPGGVQVGDQSAILGRVLK